MVKHTNQQGTAASPMLRNCKRTNVFVRLDLEMLNNFDMTVVKEKYGLEGWGIVIYIMKFLVERRTDCRAPIYAVSDIARACHRHKSFILQLIGDFPSLFTIEPGNQVFSSPYLTQFFRENSTKKEKTKTNLDKLTNETPDNQELNPSKNKNKEQEQIKDEEKEVEKADVDADSSKNNSQSGTKLSAKADTPSAACTLQRNHAKATAMAKSQVAPVRHREEGIPRQLLSQLYQDNDYMASLEHMANLAVCKNFTVRRNVLFWFWHYCQMHAKHVRSAADAKDYFANLMRPGSNTRAQFMAYQNHLYEQRSLAQHH